MLQTVLQPGTGDDLAKFEEQRTSWEYQMHINEKLAESAPPTLTDNLQHFEIE